MLYAGHDGVWYWVKAREYVKKKQNWNAFLLPDGAVFTDACGLSEQFQS